MLIDTRRVGRMANAVVSKATGYFTLRGSSPLPSAGRKKTGLVLDILGI